MEQISVKLSYAGAHRRFKIKGDGPETFFNDLMRNIAQLSAQDAPFDVAWQDEDGDSIIISRPVELGEAIDSRKDDLLRLHCFEEPGEDRMAKSEKEAEGHPKSEKTPQGESSGNDAIHGNILCDVCDATIIGIRYKCILCPDYDLCQNCERTGVHAQHGMIRIVDPMSTYVPWGARLRYTRQPGDHRHTHRSADPHGVIHRFRMQEKKEQLSEQVAKGMQYLTDIGQVVTSALANFGIDASYEVQVPADKKEEKVDGKKQGSEVKKEEKDEKSKSGSPSSPPSTPKDGAGDSDHTTKEKKNETETKRKPISPVISFPKCTRHFTDLQSAEANYRRAARKTSDGSAKVSEHRREQDTEMKKETRTAPLFGVGGRGPFGSSRGPYSRTFCHDRDHRDYSRFEECRRTKDEDRFEVQRNPRYRGHFDEQKRARDTDSDMSSRDRHRWWSPSYEDYTSSSRRNIRFDDYDPYEFSCGSTRKMNDSSEKESKSKNNERIRSVEKNLETKSKRPADFNDVCNERSGDHRSLGYLGELSRRNRSSRPDEEGLVAAVEEAARRELGIRDTNCRCFVAKFGRSQIRSQCPACTNAGLRQGRKAGQSTSRNPFERVRMPDVAVPAADEEQIEKKEDSEPVAKADAKEDIFVPKSKHDSYDHCCSTDSSEDSDFEALSYESIPDEVEKEKWSSASAPQQPVEEEKASAPAPEEINDPAPTATLYPALSAEAQPVEPPRFGEDQSIANRLIEMGFSAEEVFRVVRMHGCNFERCIEEILAKEP